jgi:2-polyprenyl-3-methyl-5-hydroxy-6-metoxy-1,4-benzoquinol methylase
MAFSAAYAARLARHAFVDAVLAPVAEAVRARDAGATLRAATITPFVRVCSLLRYKLLLSPRGMGRPIPKRTWDFEYGGNTWAGLDSEQALAGNMAIVEFVGRLWPAPEVLDVGCGTGTLAALLQAVPGLAYTGIDVSDVALSRARARRLANARFVQGAMEDWIPAGRYHAIVFNEVLYYAASPLAVLARYVPALAPAGAFIVSIWRAGNSALIWHGIEQRFEVAACTTVQVGVVTRDIKVLRPRPEGAEARGC